MNENKSELDQSRVSAQYEYMRKVREFFGPAEAAPRYAFVETYGCQQNEADSETIRGMALEMGYRLTASIDEADLIVFNTCAVREHAEQRVFGNVGATLKLKRRKPGLVIAVCGCMAGEQHVAERLEKSFPYVSIVCSALSLWRFPELLFDAVCNGRRVIALDKTDGVIAEGLPLHRDRSVCGWLPIMYGCNNFCTYCIVPYVRGRERSRRPEEVVASAREMLGSGIKDITLLGQNVNSYAPCGMETTGFPDLLREINAVPGEYRLRFMTSHPKDAGERLFSSMAECEHVAHHLHLPFQSGSDRVLKAMNRGYTAAHYRELIASARSAMPDLVLTSDVIVGFPGETEEDFRQTLELVRELRFDALFTFIYSPRRGTTAASMPDPVSKEEKSAWFDELLALQNGISQQLHSAYIGKTCRVLCDGRAEGHQDCLSARTDGGRLVVFQGPDSLIGCFLNVKITGSTTWSLSGEICQ